MQIWRCAPQSIMLLMLLLVYGMAGLANAQGRIETIVYSFSSASGITDGIEPVSLVQGKDGSFYCTTFYGGSAGYGAIVKVTPDGHSTVLHSFLDGSTAHDGYYPVGLILMPDGGLCGFTDGGDVVFRMSPSGQYSILYTFGRTSSHDGSNPNSLILGADGNFYGTTLSGGDAGEGTVFKLTPDGTETILHSFDGGNIRGDGYTPMDLVQGHDGNLYGVTQLGGAGVLSGDTRGTVFKLTLAGQFTLLHSFSDGTVLNDGQHPRCLTLGADGNLYGATSEGGSSNRGVIFKVTLAGDETILHSIGDGSVLNEGWGGVCLTLGADGILYGTTTYGGSTQTTSNTGYGTVFQLTPTGHVAVLRSFNDGSVPHDGYSPWTKLIEGLDHSLYGATPMGGIAGDGTLYKISVASATFIKTDTTTQGNWKGVYGTDGWNIAGDPSANNPTYPSYASVSVTGASTSVPAPSTSDVRALLKAAPGTIDRVAGMWNSITSETFDIALTDGYTHRITLYFLDWDNSARVQSITIKDAATGAVLDTRSVSGFQNGIYDVWDISGHVALTVTYTGPTGSNSAVSGIFFGQAGTNAPAAPTGLTATAGDAVAAM